jgi:hypothetical protein
MRRTLSARGALCAIATLALAIACDATGPAGDALTGARFTMTAFGGIPLPAALDADTFPGTAHYTLVADTLLFDGHGTVSDVNVERLDYVGGTQPSIVQTSRGKLHYTIEGDAGTAIGVCANNAPCVPIDFSLSFVADTGLTLQAQNAHVTDTYRRSR